MKDLRQENKQLKDELEVHEQQKLMIDREVNQTIQNL